MSQLNFPGRETMSVPLARSISRPCASASVCRKLARSVLESGVVYPGIATMPERFGRIALPAAVGYLERKASSIRETVGREISAYWGTK